MIHNSHNNLSLKVLTAGHDVEVAAHKNVLAACSPYFYAMFTGFTEKVGQRLESKVQGGSEGRGRSGLSWLKVLDVPLMMGCYCNYPLPRQDVRTSHQIRIL